MFSQKVKRKIQCLICPHECILQEGKIGLCNVRQNIGGKIRCKTYGKVSGYAFDPIEKKPLYHFYPGSKILSVGSYGCNLNCNFCQNWQISLGCKIDELPKETTGIDKIISDALREPSNIGIAYTYNEPTVWFEFMYDIAIEARKHGLKNVVVSNGFINEEPLLEILSVADAFNIDLKAFTESFYREMSGGSMQPVIKTLKNIVAFGKHLEITNLVIPRKNDDIDLFKEMVDWICSELGDKVVLHLSRYFPNYKQSLPYTPESTMIDMYKVAINKLKYVYLGNIRIPSLSNTYCANCNSELIVRNGYSIAVKQSYSEGKCLNCGELVAIQKGG